MLISMFLLVLALFVNMEANATVTYSKVMSGYECNSHDVDMENKNSVQECANAVYAKGGKFFIYGINSKNGRCFMEYTNTKECSEGWESDNYDFYVISHTNDKEWFFDRKTDCQEAYGHLGNLAKHHITCPANQAMIGAHYTNTCENQNREISLRYACKPTNFISGQLIEKESGLFEQHTLANVAGNVFPKCGANEGILSEWFVDSKTALVYKFQWRCLVLPTRKCTEHYTMERDVGNGYANQLMYHEMKCPRGKYLKGMEWLRNNAMGRMKYECCSVGRVEDEDEDRYHYGNTAVQWYVESSSPNGQIVLSNNWDTSDEVSKAEEHSSEFSKQQESGWNVNVCVGAETEVGAIFSKASVSFEVCAGAYGSKTSATTNSQMTSESVSNSLSVGASFSCSTSAPDFCQDEGCTMWRWSVSREYTKSAIPEWTTLRTCHVQYQRGEFKDRAPNCQPGYCNPHDPSCFTCMSMNAQFLPLQARAHDYSVCPPETCRFIPAPTREITAKVAANSKWLDSLPDCTNWKAISFSSESKFCISTGVLASGKKVGPIKNFEDFSIYKHACIRTVAPESYKLKSSPCDLSNIVTSIQECEEAWVSYGGTGFASTIVKATDPSGCFVRGEQLFYKKSIQPKSPAYDFGQMSICRTEIIHVHGKTVAEHRLRHCVKPVDHLYYQDDTCEDIRGLIQSPEECITAILSIGLMPASKVNLQILEKSDETYRAGCFYDKHEGVIFNSHEKVNAIQKRQCFLTAHKDKYLADIAGSDIWYDFAEARNHCMRQANCGGVTCRKSGKCQLRVGTTFKTSNHEETSYLKSNCEDVKQVCRMARVETVKSGETDEGDCRCATPLTGTADHNKIVCNSGFYDFCIATHECFKLGVFSKAARGTACRVPTKPTALEQTCNPNLDCGTRLVCHNPETKKLFCGAHALPTDPAAFNNAMDVDCNASPSAAFCAGEGIWNDCVVGTDKFTYRYACPVGSVMCEDGTCWKNESQCKSKPVRYGKEVCESSDYMNVRRLLSIFDRQ